MIDPSLDKRAIGRRHLLEAYTNDEAVIDELLVYCNNVFKVEDISFANLKSELEDEMHIADWKRYQSEIDSLGTIAVLKDKLVPLNFPIRSEISQQTNYRNATLKGHDHSKMEEASGLALVNPTGIELIFQDGPAGAIPALVIDAPEDFKSILQALVYKNEPVDIPDAMGASIVKGMNNWDRLNSAIQKRQAANTDTSLRKIKSQVVQDKQLYQDTIILVSRKPYSNIIPSGIDQEQWLAHSLKLRIQHEYFHYLSYRYFGSMRNNMHDELLADYMGLHAIKNSFDAQLFLQFVGLENYPEYRPGGRLENYLGNPPLSNKAFNVLCTIIYKAAKQLEQLDLKLGNPESVKNVVQRLFSISQFSLEEMASEDMLSEMAKQCLEITSY